MAEEKDFVVVKEKEDIGAVKVSGDVLATMVGLAATEVKGVSSLAGNATYDLISKKGGKALSRGVKVKTEEGSVLVELSVNIAYGFSIPEVCTTVQEHVKSAIESMTGLTVTAVDVRVAGVDMKEQ